MNNLELLAKLQEIDNVEAVLERIDVESIQDMHVRIICRTIKDSITALTEYMDEYQSIAEFQAK